MQSLGGGNLSTGTGVSSTGSVIVGVGTVPGNHTHAFRWTAATGMQDMGLMAGALPRTQQGYLARPSKSRANTRSFLLPGHKSLL